MEMHCTKSKAIKKTNEEIEIRKRQNKEQENSYKKKKDEMRQKN